MTTLTIDQLDRFGPDHCEAMTPAQAADYTRRLVHSHYENFTVVSWFLPQHLRDDFANVYAFCRWADDLGDETGDPARSVELLNWWRTELDRCYEGQPRHPVFIALAKTIETHDIPRKPFDDLIDAFLQDQTVTRYETFDQVVDYCTRSADPVGRLVLYLAGHRDTERQQLSDATCTALQLTNFWQDVRRDILERDRVYIPAEVAAKHGLDIDLMVNVVQCDGADELAGEKRARCRACPPSSGISALLPSYRATIRELVGQTWPMFERGRKLWPMVDREVRLDIRLFTWGGEAILRRIEKRGYNSLQSRPRLGRTAKTALMLRASAVKVFRLG